MLVIGISNHTTHKDSRGLLMRLGIIFSFMMLLTIGITIVFPSTGQTQDSSADTMEKEIKELKKENEDLKNRLDNLEIANEETKLFIENYSKLVEISGYADVEYQFTNQQNENNKFRIHHLSLFFNKDIQKEWKLFSEVEYEDAPLIESSSSANTVQGKIFVEQVYIEYHPELNWDVRIGRFITPAGIWSIYHYPPYVPTQREPLLFNVIFPETSDGAQIITSFPFEKFNLDTHLYIANGSGNSGGTDLNNNKAVGARLNFDSLSNLSGGASYYREKDNTDSLNSSYGLHLLFSHADLKIQTEYAIRRHEPQNTANFNDASWYAQVSYDIGKWTIAGRYDWYDPNGKAGGDSQLRYTGALNYHFAHNVIGKAEFNRNEYEDPSKKDYNELILSMVVAMGDL